MAFLQDLRYGVRMLVEAGLPEPQLIDLPSGASLLVAERHA